MCIRDREYIPEGDQVAHWSTEDFNNICGELKDSITDENTFAFMMYAANNQGDSHIMTPVSYTHLDVYKRQ